MIDDSFYSHWFPAMESQSQKTMGDKFLEKEKEKKK